MRVEEHCAFRARHAELCEHERITVGFEDLRGEAALREQSAQQVRITPNVRAVGGDVGNRQQLDKFAHDCLLMRGDELRNRLALLCRDRHRAEPYEQTDDEHRSFHGRIIGSRADRRTSRTLRTPRTPRTPRTLRTLRTLSYG